MCNKITTGTSLLRAECNECKRYLFEDLGDCMDTETCIDCLTDTDNDVLDAVIFGEYFDKRSDVRVYCAGCAENITAECEPVPNCIDCDSLS